MLGLWYTGVLCIFGESVMAGSSCGLFFFFKQKTAYEMRISDWSSDVCSSDLPAGARAAAQARRMDERLLSRPAGIGAAYGAPRRRLRRRAAPDRRISCDRRAARADDATADRRPRTHPDAAGAGAPTRRTHRGQPGGGTVAREHPRPPPGA